MSLAANDNMSRTLFASVTYLGEFNRLMLGEGLTLEFAKFKAHQFTKKQVYQIYGKWNVK